MPNRLRSNNTMVGMAEQYGKTHKDCKKEQESGLKEEKPTTKQKPSLERSKL